MKELHEALGILLEFRGKQGDFVNYDVCAEHDEIWMGGPDPSQLKPEEVKRLEELHVNWDESTQSWHMFT